MTTTNGQQYWLSETAEQPLVIADFQADDDVLVLPYPNLSRSDLELVQEGTDTVIRVNGSLIGRGDEPVTLAVLSNTQVYDVNPVPLLQAFYAALSAGDLSGVLDRVADDVTWQVSGPTDLLPWSGEWTGKQGVSDFYDRLREHVTSPNWEPKQYVAQGNTVAVILTLSGTSIKSGVSFSGDIVHWITVRNGKISLLQFYLDSFPIVVAVAGGRPFTIGASDKPEPHYVAKPLTSNRATDSIVLDPALLENPPQTVHTVRAMYAALQGLNVPEVRKVFAPDVVWDIFGAPDLLSWAGERNGPDAAAESANQILETMHFDHFKPTRMIYQGNTAAIVIDEGGTSLATGVPFKTSVVHIVVANEEGKVVLFRNYINTTWIVEAFLGGRPYSVPALP
ncbi:nuclear transport factor 2 family protein [Spirosoma aureum]|uniref:Nuclear transport factor 2 family protein n=1 Tax=Spirosoma aureum TaxID=2692134 RepID=A0A6G9AL42_9BACT|nr:nuclear transport factor 2 family protein [Spirosoma aureum]QIP13202.1 nuclear transport factor 2 family protein [Spirosoma aureum]